MSNVYFFFFTEVLLNVATLSLRFSFISIPTMTGSRDTDDGHGGKDFCGDAVCEGCCEVIYSR